MVTGNRCVYRIWVVPLGLRVSYIKFVPRQLFYVFHLFKNSIKSDHALFGYMSVVDHQRITKKHEVEKKIILDCFQPSDFFFK